MIVAFKTSTILVVMGGGYSKGELKSSSPYTFSEYLNIEMHSETLRNQRNI